MTYDLIVCNLQKLHGRCSLSATPMQTFCKGVAENKNRTFSDAKRAESIFDMM